MNKCKYGCGREGVYEFQDHTFCCSRNQSSCPEVSKKRSAAIARTIAKTGKWGNPKWLPNMDAWNKGKTYGELFGEEKSKRIKEKISHALTGKITGLAGTTEGELLRRSRISAIAKLKNFGNRLQRCGGGKRGWYKGIWCDSSWELAWVMFNLDHGVSFERNKDYFPYIWNGITHKYFPDFKLSNGQYVEIKAWMNDQVGAKLSSCPSVVLLMKKEMKPIIQYAVATYGKNFVGLYDDAKPEKIRLCSDCGSKISKWSKSGYCVKCVQKYIKDRDVVGFKRVRLKKVRVCVCGREITRNKGLCVYCARVKSRKVERPSLRTLLIETEQLGFSAVGRKYGVSDNAVRKWIRIAAKNVSLPVDVNDRVL